MRSMHKPCTIFTDCGGNRHPVGPASPYCAHEERGPVGSRATEGSVGSDVPGVTVISSFTSKKAPVSWGEVELLLRQPSAQPRIFSLCLFFSLLLYNLYARCENTQVILKITSVRIIIWWRCALVRTLRICLFGVMCALTRRKLWNETI